MLLQVPVYKDGLNLLRFQDSNSPQGTDFQAGACQHFLGSADSLTGPSGGDVSYLSIALPATRVPSLEVYMPRASTVKPPTAAVSFCLSARRLVMPSPRFLHRMPTCLPSFVANETGLIVFTSETLQSAWYWLKTLVPWCVCLAGWFSFAGHTFAVESMHRLTRRPEGGFYAFNGFLTLLL